MGVEPPPEVPFDTAELTPMRSFYGDNKRVRNNRVRQELGLALRHSNSGEGLAAMWRDGTWRA